MSLIISSIMRIAKNTLIITCICNVEIKYSFHYKFSPPPYKTCSTIIINKNYYILSYFGNKMCIGIRIVKSILFLCVYMHLTTAFN